MPAEPHGLPEATGRLRRSGAMRAIIGGAVLAAPLLLTACQPAILDPQGPIGLANKQILIGSVVIMLAIVVPTILATLGVAWWFRASNTRAPYLPDWAYSGRIELIVWSIPMLVIILLGGVAWIGSHELDPARPIESDVPPLKIQAVSLDWKWLFIYPDQGIATVNQLVVPAGVPLHFQLTSGSVMSAFFVPQLGSMIYTMNGMTTQLHLQSDQPGTFLGLSSHFNGDGFPGMHFEVQAVPSGQFTTWIDTERGKGGMLDGAAYTELSKQSMNVPPASFGTIDPHLFHQIITQALPPAPGPQEGRPDVNVSPRTQQTEQ